MILDSIGKQPGLLRMRDLMLASAIVWIPTILDFRIKNYAKGPAAALLWNPVLITFAFMSAAAAAAGLLKCFSKWPSWLLYATLFVVFFASVLLPQFVIFTAQFVVCGSPCIFL